MSGHDAEYIKKFQIENTQENREILAELIVGYWDMKDLVTFAEARLRDSWDPSMDIDAYGHWADDVEQHLEQLEDLCGTPDQ